MVGGVRSVSALYVGSDAAEGSSRSRGRGRGPGRWRGGGRGRGRGRPRSPSPVAQSSSEEEEEQVPAAHSSCDEEEADVEQEQEGEGKESGNSTSSVWLRGPLTLPKRPIPFERRPMIRPIGSRGWEKVAPSAHNRHVNGILGLLCMLHCPGMVQFARREEPAYTREHYTAFPDLPDQEGWVFPNKAERVVGELWDFFRYEPEYEVRAAQQPHKACYKLVKDMHYEARIQAVVIYNAQILKVKFSKAEARDLNMKLSREQYLQVPPWWCALDRRCWEVMVNRWCDPEWEETHIACWEWRLMMQGRAHHQGNLTLDEYAAKWSSAHDGQPCSPFMAWAMAPKGKATSDVNYSPDDPPSAYSNASVYSRLNDYTSMAREVHGPEYDLSTQPIDGEIVMRVGGDKKHGRCWFGDNTLDSATTPTLSQIRARSTSSSPVIRPRMNTTQSRMEAL